MSRVMSMFSMTMSGIAGLALMASLGGGSAGAVTLPDEAPLPAPRPAAPVPGLAALTTSIPHPMASHDAQLVLLRQGLDALTAGDLAAARGAREELEPDTLDSRIMVWAIALSGHPGVGSGEIEAALETLDDWPGRQRLIDNRERALARANLTPRERIDVFAGAPPVTFEATMALARAHLALKDEDAARAVLDPFWRRQMLDPAQEARFLEAFAEMLPAETHRHRMERMLYERRIRSAERIAERAGGEALTKAWAAVIRGNGNAGKLLDAVPEAERTAGYVFAKARHLRRSGAYHEAAEVMKRAPTDPAELIDADEWWFERRALSRELLDMDKPHAAYEIVAAHEGGSDAARADAAFHAGWYALRFLDEPETAAEHFPRIVEVADGPISLARAHYWLGRAVEAGAPGEAEAHYRRAARHGTAFYGQLAAAKLGQSVIRAAAPRPSRADRVRFARRETVEAIDRLDDAGHEWHAAILYDDLADSLADTGELTLLAAMAEHRGDHYRALRIGKAAARRGLEIGALAHPVGAIPKSAAISGAGKALAYAVARQESEFNTGAVSGVGARGLLQLMPRTAEAMARKAGLPYSGPRLTRDAGYNATLGATYLGDQLERFDGSYILTFIGYNAGPARASQWIARYGDPRGQPVETVVDWVERIPFTETRNYVQRVMENYQVYKMRLSGRFDIEGDLMEGRGAPKPGQGQG